MPTQPEQHTTLNIISYARISDDGEGDEHGVRNQHIVNRRTAKRHGWKVVLELTDNDRSASKADVTREDFERMLAILHDGKLNTGDPIHGVVIVAGDRLARRAGDYERFVEALTCRDGRVFADERGPKDLYSEDVEGLGLVGVAFSKIESRKIRRRLIAWHRARAESGKPTGGTRPFGWQADRLMLEPVEAALLNKAGDDVIAGRSINSIILEWRERQILTSMGNLWTPRSLKVTLNNPRLCGWRRAGDDVLRNDAGEPILGTWQPVMSPTKWLAIHAVLDARRNKMRAPGETYREVPPDFYATKYLLTGIARCGKPRHDGVPCGTPMRATHQRHCVQHIYICQPKSVGGCSGVGRRGDKVDEFVSEAILAKLEQRTAVADGRPWVRADELAVVNAKVQSLRDQWLAGGISDDFFYPTLQRLEQQRRELRKDEAKHAASLLRAQSDLTDIRRRWYTNELDLSQKRALVKEALHAVIVHPVGPGGRGRAAFNPDLLELVWRS